MGRALRFVFVALGVLFAALVVAYALGAMLPRRHVAVTSATLAAPGDEVWLAVSDMQSQPTWRSDLESARRLEDHDGRPVWLQHTGSGDWRLELTEVEPPDRLVATVADSSQGFGGTWTYVLAAQGDSTRLTITENGFIDSPLFRFFARFVYGLHGTQETYLRDLGRHFGQDVRTVREN